MQVQRVVGSKGVDVKISSERYRIWDNQDNLLGSLYINKTRLVWCEGKTQFNNGIPIEWGEFIENMKKRPRQ